MRTVHSFVNANVDFTTSQTFSLSQIQQIPRTKVRSSCTRSGKKIFDKIMDVMQPEFADEEPINPFDFWEGASFKLKIRNVEGYRNYDKSEFSSPAPLSNDDSELEAIYDKQYDLNEFTDPANYKSYDELYARLQLVLGEANNAGYTPAMKEMEAPAPSRVAPAPAPKSVEPEEDDTLSYLLSWQRKISQSNYRATAVNRH